MPYTVKLPRARIERGPNEPRHCSPISTLPETLETTGTALSTVPRVTESDVPDQISAYVATLGALWALGAAGPDADRAEIRGLLADVTRQCDELGATFALAVARQASRDWSAREGRCAFCGLAGIFHDPETGQEVHLGTAP